MILGISGTNSAGKDSVARILKDAGFEQFSLSDAIREEAKARGLPSDRDVLIKLGNELREKLGPGILGERILDLIKKKKVEKASVISIRNPAEAKALSNHDDFFLVWVDAPPQLRYERSLARHRDKSDSLSYDDFIAMENLERDAGPSGQRLDVLEEMARFKIDNTGSIEELNEKVDSLIESISR
ncbi:MAG: AAA family ATPase [Nanoarchaeota archaeon]